VFEIPKGLQRLRVELQQHRPQAVDGVMQRPDGFLMLSCECLHRAGLVAHGPQRAVQVSVSARMCESTAASGVGFAAGLTVAFPIAGHHARVAP